jgi:hypothetical protein
MSRLPKLEKKLTVGYPGQSDPGKKAAYHEGPPAEEEARRVER